MTGRVKRVAVIGAGGYTGREILRLLERHPRMQVDLAMTARPDHHPAPPDLPVDPVVQPLDLDALRYVDGVFTCTPHGAAAPLVREALERGCKVVDLSADFRLRDLATWERTYELEHRAPDLLEEAVYGLTEHARNRIAAARLVANPGCYPTAILLALLPLLREGLLADAAPIVADAKSGVSGAGKTPSPRTHFGNVHENFLAYGVGRHRHTPEIWQEAGTRRIVFVPHLLPVFRGILATVYVTPATDADAEAILACLDRAYAAEPFVRVYSTGLPELNRVQRTNYCDLGVAPVAAGLVAIVSAIDNLGKGAAGQAIQNMNLMLGLEEGEGL